MYWLSMIVIGQCLVILVLGGNRLVPVSQNKDGEGGSDERQYSGSQSR